MALQKHFKAKRDHVLARLKDLHLEVDIPPTSTFYIWLNLEKLPAPLNNGLVCVVYLEWSLSSIDAIT
jgi:aspartate/methionine/tyrosine aminotransferase